MTIENLPVGGPEREAPEDYIDNLTCPACNDQPLLGPLPCGVCHPIDDCICGPQEPHRSIRADCPIHGERDPLGLGRVCAICGVVAVSSKDPATDFCRMCWATGRSEERTLDADGRGTLARIRALDAVYTANVWQTGGGCMVLAIELLTGEFVSASYEDDAGIPPAEGPWGVIVSETLDAWSDWDEERLEIVGLVGDGTDAALVAYVAARAAKARVEFDEHGCAHPDDDLVAENDGRRCKRCGSTVDGDYKTIATACAACDSAPVEGDCVNPDCLGNRS